MEKSITGESLRSALNEENEDQTDKLSREFKLECMALAKRYLAGAWLSLAEDEFKVTKITGGLSNLIFKIDLPDYVKPVAFEPRCALIRIHGTSSQSALIIDTIIFTILSERNMGPKLYGIFSDGRIEEYVPSRSLSKMELHKEIVQKNVALVLSQIHSLVCPLKKESALIDQGKKWLRNIERKIGRDAKWEVKTTQIDPIYAKNIPNVVTLDDLYNELKHVDRCLKASKSPIVFCHNDLQEGNILLSDAYEITEDGELKKKNEFRIGSKDEPFFVIDYEYACYNFRGFDFGNHFCEWGISYDTEDPCGYTIIEEHFPTREKMALFITEYLKNLYSNQNADARHMVTYDFAKDMKILSREGERFMVVSHFFWSLWALEMETHKEIEFGYIPYGLDRLCLYFDGKRKLSNYLKE
uniref:Choline/ethanolamine kinase n=1 Tax=Parastrongyloides trichosuri TaxID=131310 RepID=A0A0N4ZBF9_PARTI